MRYPIEYLLAQVKKLWIKITVVEESTTVDFVHKSGDTMTGALVLSQDPASALEAATKQYVDNVDEAEEVVFEFLTPTNPWLYPHGKGKVPSNIRTLVRLPADPTALYEYNSQVIDTDSNNSKSVWGANYEGRGILTFN